MARGKARVRVRSCTGGASEQDLSDVFVLLKQLMVRHWVMLWGKARV